MNYRQLGQTDVVVSSVCLGTMTFGEQNTEGEAHAQLNTAVELGINFIDTAEIYPVPPKRETQGRTETLIGTWLQSRKRRDDVVLASKVVGPGDWVAYLRKGHVCLDKRNIQKAIHQSLQRLGTDYIDLYQVHWPDRETVFFGKRLYEHPLHENSVPIESTLEALDDLVRAGKVREIGISNETPWGLMRYLRASEENGLQRIASIQNPFNLLNRTFEFGFTEIAVRERVSLLAYSPLGFGVLSGKYLDGARPTGARLTLFDRFTRYSSPQGEVATRAYVELAKAHGLDPAQMALAYVISRRFVTSTIVGATSVEQLVTNINSVELTLSDEVRNAIETIHCEQSNPCP